MHGERQRPVEFPGFARRERYVSTSTLCPAACRYFAKWIACVCIPPTLGGNSVRISSNLTSEFYRCNAPVRPMIGQTSTNRSPSQT
jgi:hypothetical protein